MTQPPEDPRDAPDPAGLGETRIGPRTFVWGKRTYVMGILNVTPDSFSGDGLFRPGGETVKAALERARLMVEEGADLIDVGGESTRPGHEPVDADEERRRIVPVIAALREAMPDLAISVDTTKPIVAEAAIGAGAGMVNDVWGVGEDDTLIRLAARRGVPIVLMHNRREANYTDVVAEVVAELGLATERAVAAGIPRENVIIDPGFGFGKTIEHNLTVLRDLAALKAVGRPILLGTSRKSTLGRVLDLPPLERVEATMATTALGVASGVDIVRVHDIRPNVRSARMADAIVRGNTRPAAAAPGAWPR
jgi:dihydropteroate synthase